jgi:putative DNA primase/helicase
LNYASTPAAQFLRNRLQCLVNDLPMMITCISYADPRNTTIPIVHPFSPTDSWQDCRDYVSARLATMGIHLARSSPILGMVNKEALPRSDYAMRIWDETVEPVGTLVARYLEGRKLVLPDCADALRFHPSCPFGPKTRVPCMVALYRDICTNQPCAIHRTALTADGQKIDRKVLGPKRGCAIKLTPDEDVTTGLTIAEGIETALAGMALGFQPTWALGDAAGIKNFPVLSGIECLTILVDQDATGRAAAMECSRRWTVAGREVFRVVPNSDGADIADVVSGRAA